MTKIQLNIYYIYISLDICLCFNKFPKTANETNKYFNGY